jgi:hypothetical protein
MALIILARCDLFLNPFTTSLRVREGGQHFLISLKPQGSPLEKQFTARWLDFFQSQRRKQRKCYFLFFAKFGADRVQVYRIVQNGSVEQVKLRYA